MTLSELGYKKVTFTSFMTPWNAASPMTTTELAIVIDTNLVHSVKAPG